jgi:hypothetical protein
LPIIDVSPFEIIALSLYSEPAESLASAIELAVASQHPKKRPTERNGLIMAAIRAKYFQSRHKQKKLPCLATRELFGSNAE